jgi:hypothetical protein
MKATSGGTFAKSDVSSIIGLVLIICIESTAYAYDDLQPSWWKDRNVITTNTTLFINNSAPINQGQVKWFALQAYEEFQEKLPGAGNSNIQQRVDGFTDQDNHLPVNIGQLKYVSVPCYDRLAEYGLAGSYPWTNDPALINDYAIATVGDLKNFFNFELPVTTNLYYVATDGSNDNPGTIGQPFQTISHAVERINPGDTVLIRSGIYQEQVIITNSGTADLPITIRAFADESPRIIGAIKLDPADFQPVLSNDLVWSRLHPDAKGNIFKLDLSTYTTNFGTLESREGQMEAYNSYLELFYKDKPMELARYPDKVEASDYKGKVYNELSVTNVGADPDISGTYSYAGEKNGFPCYEMKRGDLTFEIYNSPNRYFYYIKNENLDGVQQKWVINSAASGAWPCGIYKSDIWSSTPGKGTVSVKPVAQRLSPGFMLVAGTDGISHINISEDPISRWSSATNAFSMGFWKYLYRANHLKVLKITPAEQAIHLTPPSGGIESDRAFFIYNLLEELSFPEEWFLDTDSGFLYFWPPNELDNSIYVSALQEPLVQLNNVEYVKVEGVTIEMTRRDLIHVNGGKKNRLENCVIRNCGGNGAKVNGKSNGLVYCNIYNTGECGIWIYGGDRFSLTPGNNYVRNSEIHHFGRLFWTLRQGVRLTAPYPYDHAVGQIIEHNHIHSAPHQAILIGGNNHRITYNDIHDVCEWAGDAGVIYGAREWGAYGNKIQYNFIHHIESLVSPLVYGLYLDDMLSGTTVSHNLFYRAGPKFPCFISGGRDNRLFNNIFYNSAYALHVDNRGVYKIKGDQSSWDLLWKLNRYDYQNEPWSLAYPELAAIPNSWEEISGTHWLWPEGCSFSKNVANTKLGFINETNHDQSSTNGPLSVFEEVQNGLNNVEPLFMDEKTMDLDLRNDSPVFSIPGFEDIPFDKIGIEPKTNNHR